MLVPSTRRPYLWKWEIRIPSRFRQNTIKTTKSSTDSSRAWWHEIRYLLNTSQLIASDTVKWPTIGNKSFYHAAKDHIESLASDGSMKRSTYRSREIRHRSTEWPKLPLKKKAEMKSKSKPKTDNTNNLASKASAEKTATNRYALIESVKHANRPIRTHYIVCWYGYDVQDDMVRPAAHIPHHLYKAYSRKRRDSQQVQRYAKNMRKLREKRQVPRGTAVTMYS